MNPSVEDVKTLLNSSDYGDRMKGLNQARLLDLAVAFELLKVAANDSNDRIRYAAVSQIAVAGQANREEAAVLLRNLLHNDKEIDVKAAAADSLAALKCEGAFDDLEGVFRASQDWLLQMSIVAALGEMGDPRAFDFLVEVIEAGDPLLQGPAVGALGELGDPRAVPILANHLKHEDWQLRYQLVQAFARLGGDAAQNALAQLTQDPVELVAQEAKVALSQPSA